MCKHLAILGASYLQLPLIEKAKEMGIKKLMKKKKLIMIKKEKIKKIKKKKIKMK